MYWVLSSTRPGTGRSREERSIEKSYAKYCCGAGKVAGTHQGINALCELSHNATPALVRHPPWTPPSLPCCHPQGGLPPCSHNVLPQSSQWRIALCKSLWVSAFRPINTLSKIFQLKCRKPIPPVLEQDKLQKQVCPGLTLRFFFCLFFFLTWECGPWGSSLQAPRVARGKACPSWREMFSTTPSPDGLAGYPPVNPASSDNLSYVKRLKWVLAYQLNFPFSYDKLRNAVRAG